MKKIIILICCLFLLYGCGNNKLGTFNSYADKLEFIDSNGYILSIYYDEEDNINKVDWIIVTDSEEEAKNFAKTYSNQEDLFNVEIDNKTVIINYTEEYINQLFDGVSKSDLEKYLRNNGYNLVSE